MCVLGIERDVIILAATTWMKSHAEINIMEFYFIWIIDIAEIKL